MDSVVTTYINYTAMREIKFRGKRNNESEWLYGHYFINRGLHFIVNDGIAPAGNTFLDYEVDPETVGQFTGLRDKKGREIYEGDVLGAGNKVIGWVEGDVRGYCYDVVYIKKDVNDSPAAGDKRWSLYSTIQYDYPNMIEVIGNVHDNPELMEEKK